MEDYQIFEDICPYSDEEAVKALGDVSRHPAVPIISKFLFPEERAGFLAETLRSIRSIDEFQQVVMSKAVDWCLENTVHNFSYDGMSNIESLRTKFLVLSNHRGQVPDDVQPS